ncbi:MAG TPA: hypothetical protein VIK87_04385 [Sphingomonadales bacterium]
MSGQDPDEQKRRVRNYVTAGLLFALVILFFFITIAKLKGAN